MSSSLGWSLNVALYSNVMVAVLPALWRGDSGGGIAAVP